MESNVLIFCMDEETDYDNELKKKQNEFLDIYSLYQKTGLSLIKEELLRKAYQLHILDPRFTFHI